jgi:hypothetical protein
LMGIAGSTHPTGCRSGLMALSVTVSRQIT